MDIITIDPTTDARWHTLVTQQASSVFHSPAWIATVRDTYDLDIRALLLCDEAGQPQAGMPLCRVEHLTTPHLVSMPFSDYCDPLVSTPQQWAAFSRRLQAEGLPATVRCLHNPLPLEDEQWHCYSRARWHLMDVRPDLDTLWESIDSGSHRAIRKARNEGVTVHVAQNKDELHAFYMLHLKVRKYKYTMLAQPYRFLEAIWDAFVERGQGALLLAAAADGTIIGGVFSMVWKDTLYYKFNASDSNYLALRPNDLAIWEAIRYAKARGLAALDFGLSDWDQEGLIHYKSKFASEEGTISFLRNPANPTPSPRDNDIRTLLTRLTVLFTQVSVPDDITAQAGDVLYRYFS